MPSDFLRDVFHTDDAARRAPRRWPLFPLSLAVHVLGAAAYFVIPLAAEVTPPTPRPLHADQRILIRVLPPDPVVDVSAPGPRRVEAKVGGSDDPQLRRPSLPVVLPMTGLPVGFEHEWTVLTT